MKTIDLKLPACDLALILDSMRHYIKHIDSIDEDLIDNDALADILNDYEVLKCVESNISQLFAKEFGQY